jgi:hypothetical protein
MMRLSGMPRYGALIAALSVLALALPTRSPAFEPAGACCLANGACENLIAAQCETLGGDFVGAETSCATTDCTAPVAAPMLSIFGFVALIGGLGGLGAYRLFLRRRHA